MDGYVTIQECRDEGITVAQASDSRLATLIARAQSIIDLHTGRHFKPVDKTLHVDGTGSFVLPLSEPIVAVTAVKILRFDISGLTFDDVSLDDVGVYNRHLTENLLDPDDREDPRLEWIDADLYHIAGHGAAPQPRLRLDRWPRGSQNIEITGTFGYTDYDTNDAEGKTPDLIKWASILLVIQHLALATDTEGRDDAGVNRFRARRFKTRDQEVAFESASKLGVWGVGPYTGNAEVDAIIERFRRPLAISAA